MSSILDALKKSERQRSLGRELIFRRASNNTASQLTGFAIAVLAALVILILAIGALLLNLREPEPQTVLSPVEAIPPATPKEVRTKRGSNNDIAAAVPLAPADMRGSLDSSVLLGAKEVPKTAKPENPAPAKIANSRRGSPTVQNSDEAPWLSSLPQSFRSSLPPLAVNIHVYSPDITQRILYINNRPVKQGERIEGGVMIEEIVHNGVVLQFRGQRFRLPRPN